MLDSALLRSAQNAQSQLGVAGLSRSGMPNVAVFQVRWFGASASDEKSVKARMRSVKSIQKITKAMKMVAASKLKHDQRRLDAGLPFANPVQNLFKLLPIHQKAANVDAGGKNSLALICLSSDKGLCGGVNSSIAKLARSTTAREEAAGSVVKIFGVGEKIRGALQGSLGDRFARIVSEVAKHPFNFAMASVIAQRIIEESPARTAILHNHFRSVISYATQRVDILTEDQAHTMEKRELDGFEFEPERRDLWQDIHHFYLASSIYGCMLDNIASEQSARMSAMDSASKNAGEMLSSLTLAYNKARQARITKELVEIISGAQAQ